MSANAVLCYVKDNFAYFTTQPLSEQWGDDWDDAPYEHNAGEPYDFHEHDREAGRKPWEIVKVAFGGPLETPDDGCVNSRWSVKQINAGCVAWLATPSWSGAPLVAIPAGTTLAQFCYLVEQAGGEVYLRKESQ